MKEFTCVLTALLLMLAGLFAVGANSLPKEKEFICENGSSIRYSYEMDNPEVLCGALNY